MKKKIVVIAGPTAVGKTKYAIETAKALHGEIVSADSMQLYKFMDIGSAKPTADELAQAKHHLVDEIDPSEPFSVAAYQKLAKDAINHIFDAGKLPVISGGTGLYINSLVYDMDFSAPPPACKDDYRQKMEQLAAEKGNEYVHSLLAQKDPAAAERIHANNLKKVIRALEVVETSGEGIRAFEQSFVKTSDYDVIMVGLNRNRDELYERINLRADMIFEAGLVEEIKNLLNRGLTVDNISMKGIGYKEVIEYLNGTYDIEEAVRLVKQNSRHYAKRQLTWMRRYEDMKWFNISDYDSDEKALEDVISWVKNRL